MRKAEQSRVSSGFAGQLQATDRKPTSTGIQPTVPSSGPRGISRFTLSAERRQWAAMERLGQSDTEELRVPVSAIVAVLMGRLLDASLEEQATVLAEARQVAESRRSRTI